MVREFSSCKSVALLFVATLFCGQAMGQLVEKRTFVSQKKSMHLIIQLFVRPICRTGQCIRCATLRLVI